MHRELTIQEPASRFWKAHHMEKGQRTLQDYDLVMDKVAEAEELGLSNKPSTLEKLQNCPSAICRSNPSGCKKERNGHEL